MWCSRITAKWCERRLNRVATMNGGIAMQDFLKHSIR